MPTVIRIDNLSKYYRLGLIGGGTLREDVNRWIARARGKPDPLLKVGETDHGNRKGGQIWALRDINLEVQEGEILGIIGRNGAGKSTLLKILSKITAPTAGRIKIKGRVGSLLEVGTGFHPELTGRENIYLNGTILGMTRAEVSSKLDEIVEFSEIGEFIDTPVKRYSSGMTVRLAFAVAAHLEPEILIVDEVLAVGDLAFQKKCLGKMKDVVGHGRTVLFVSHNMASINQLCSRTVLLEKGILIANGETEAVVGDYQRKSKSNAKDLRRDLKENLEKNGVCQYLEILDVAIASSSNEKDIIRTGSGIKIAITYSLKKQLKSAAFAVSIKDIFGQELLRLSTNPISGYEIAELYSFGKIVLTVDELPLVAGVYSIDVHFFREKSEWLISLEDIVALDVAPYDYYGSGMALDRSKGAIVVGHNWDHVELDG